MQELIYDGPFPRRAPQNIQCFCTCFCGDRLFLLGFRPMIVVSPNEPESVSIAMMPCLTEFASSSGESFNYMIEDLEQTNEFVDMYAIGEEYLGVILSCEANSQIIQVVWKLNRSNETIDCITERKFTFKGIQNCRIGIGTFDSKSILLVGKCGAENGEAIVMKSIAANPLQIAKYPDKSYDKEIAELEQMCKNHPHELLLFPNCVPFINSNGIYYLLGRVKGNTINFEGEYIGAIRPTKDGTKAEIIPVKGVEAMKSIANEIKRDLNVGWCSYVTQRQQTAWMSFVIQKPENHWKFKVQNLAIVFCQFLIRYVGRPLIAFGQYDGGFLANAFANFYLWLCPDLVPNLGPTPDLVLLALDLRKDMMQFRHVKFLGNDSELRSYSSSIMVDATINGGLITAEASLMKRRIRVSKVENPFRVKSLLETAYEAANELYPSFSKDQNHNLLRLRNIYNFGGCILHTN